MSSNSSKEAKDFERTEKNSSMFMAGILIDVEKKVFVLLDGVGHFFNLCRRACISS
jgi:hypothetical protein